MMCKILVRLLASEVLFTLNGLAPEAMCNLLSSL